MTTTLLTKPAITISRAALAEAEGVIILSFKEYQKLKEQSSPVFYLKGASAKKIDQLVTNGLKSYKQGKTKKITSLADLE